MQLFSLLVGTYNDAKDTPAMPACKQERLHQSANLDLDHVGTLLPFMALLLSPRIFTVAMQQVLGLYSVVEVVPSS